jgi:hypothetical protein
MAKESVVGPRNPFEPVSGPEVIAQSHGIELSKTAFDDGEVYEISAEIGGSFRPGGLMDQIPPGVWLDAWNPLMDGIKDKSLHMKVWVPNKEN